LRDRRKSHRALGGRGAGPDRIKSRYSADPGQVSNFTWRPGRDRGMDRGGRAKARQSRISLRRRAASMAGKHGIRGRRSTNALPCDAAATFQVAVTHRDRLKRRVWGWSSSSELKTVAFSWPSTRCNPATSTTRSRSSSAGQSAVAESHPAARATGEHIAACGDGSTVTASWKPRRPTRWARHPMQLRSGGHRSL
jgi:hypothetical protein